MCVQTGKTFITVLIAIALASAGFAWLSSDARKEPTAFAQTTQASAPQPESANESSANANGETAKPTGYEDGYRAGYRDGHQDCSIYRQASSVRRAGYSRRYAPRARVASARYYASPRRGHSTRNMILTIAAPAAIGAGIGGIARGGKGAGIGALIGGGGGALYHLIKHRRD